MKFFHAIANERRRENTIGSVEDDGKTIFGEGAKREYFFNYIKSIFS